MKLNCNWNIVIQKILKREIVWVYLGSSMKSLVTFLVLKFCKSVTVKFYLNKCGEAETFEAKYAGFLNDFYRFFYCKHGLITATCVHPSLLDSLGNVLDLRNIKFMIN